MRIDTPGSFARHSLVSLTCLVLFSGCNQLLVKPAESDQNLADFEFAWKIVDSTYQYLEFKQIDWDSLQAVYRDRTLQARGDEFYQVLSDLLAELKDGHIYFAPPGGLPIYPYHPPRLETGTKAFDHTVVRKYFADELALTPDREFAYGSTSDSIGYVYIARFSPNGLVAIFDTVLREMRHTKALILDDRCGAGGNRIDVYQLVSRFLTEQIETPVWYKLGQQESWGPLHPAGPYPYHKPVVVLINGAAFSSRELFAEMMKHLPNVTVIGDTTGGGASGVEKSNPLLSGDYELPSGKMISIPTYDGRRYDGLPWETIGIPPHILVEQTEKDISRGRDLQLEYALNYLE